MSRLPFNPQPKQSSRRFSEKKAAKLRTFIDQVWERDGYWLGDQQVGQCWICQRAATRGVDGTVDHIKLRSTDPGLRHDPRNGKIAHRYCNFKRKAEGRTA